MKKITAPSFMLMTTLENSYLQTDFDDTGEIDHNIDHRFENVHTQ